MPKPTSPSSDDIELMPPERVDGWIFLAIQHGNDGNAASLTEVIAAADWINHALPTDGELRNGVNRLIASGLVQITDLGFSLTSGGRALVGRLGSRSGLHRQLDRFADEWRMPASVNNAWAPGPTEISDAVEQYRSAMRRRH